MTLNDWMTKTGTQAAEIARFVGCDRSWISHLRNGKADPSLKTIDMIAIFTDGAVGRADWPLTVTDPRLSASGASAPAQPATPPGDQT